MSKVFDDDSSWRMNDDYSRFNTCKEYRVCKSCNQEALMAGKICRGCDEGQLCYECAKDFINEYTYGDEEVCPYCNQKFIINDESYVCFNYNTNSSMVLPICFCKDGECNEDCACGLLGLQCKFDCLCHCTKGNFKTYDKQFVPINSLPKEEALKDLIKNKGLSFRCGCELYSTCEENCFCRDHGVQCELCACCSGDVCFGNCTNGLGENDEYIYWNKGKERMNLTMKIIENLKIIMKIEM
eukprot:TRINITY_DN314_c1_g1_i10.p1 TRINITY_DN314_c1_g1~~TRINITY_DN314_c1_g1_i10.p1  ORF type:complete len:241 (-),score=37.84 TRINITY_DN314_c1_g1_i10:304-1026(-)